MADKLMVVMQVVKKYKELAGVNLIAYKCK